MASSSRVQSAKRAIIGDASHLAWFVSAGIALVDGQKGVVVSVEPGCRARAQRRIALLRLPVPCSVREVRNVRSRSSS